MKHTQRNGFAPILIVLVIAILGVVGYVGYKNYFLNKANSPLIFVTSDSEGNLSFFKSNLEREKEVDISSYFKGYSFEGVSPNGKYIIRSSDQGLEISPSNILPFSFKKLFSITTKNNQILQTVWSPDSTKIVISVVDDNTAVIPGESSKTIYLVDINTMESKILNIFEKGRDLSLESFDNEMHKIHISQSPASTGIIIPGTETFSSIDTITGEVIFEDPSKITTSIEIRNGHKYFISRENTRDILYDLDLSQNTKRVIFDTNTNDGNIKAITYLPPENKQFVFTGWIRNNETGKYGRYTFYAYDIKTNKLSTLVGDLNGTNSSITSPDGRYVRIRPSIANDEKTNYVFNLNTKTLNLFSKDEDILYFYWLAD